MRYIRIGEAVIGMKEGAIYYLKRIPVKKSEEQIWIELNRAIKGKVTEKNSLESKIKAMPYYAGR